MSGDRQARLQLTGDASGFNAAADSAAQHIGGVGAAAEHAQKSLGGLAASTAAYERAAKNVKPAWDVLGVRSFQTIQREIDQVNAAYNRLERSGKYSGAELTRAQSAQQAAVKRLKDEMAAAGAGIEGSSKQAAAALRMLPAQATDVATQLAGGANPLLVLLQQGGQVKDSFGGLAPMFRGIAAAISPTVAVVGGLVTVAGLLTAAFASGQAESRAYAQAIVMSGNAAGVTVGKLQATAAAVASSIGSQGQAAEALAKATATGRVSAANLGLVAEAALRMERDVGISVDETIKTFVLLASKPAEASRALNEQYHYLDVATYKRIAALETQKRFEEAAALAQSTYAEAMSKRSKAMEEDLGLLERAARAVLKAFKDMWAEAEGLGRKDTTQSRLKEVREQLAKSQGTTGYVVEDFFYKLFDLRSKAQKAEQEGNLRDQEAYLQELERLESRKAQQDAQAAAKNESGIAAAAEAAKHADAMRKARYQAELQAIDLATKAKTEALAQQQRLVDAQLSAGVITEAEAYRQRRELIQREAAAEVEGLAKRNAALAAQKVKFEEAIARDAEVAKNKAEAARIQAKASGDIAVLNAQEAASLRALALATKQYREELDAALASRGRQNQRDLDGLGMGDQARDRASRRAGIDDKFADDLRKLDADRAANKLPESEYQQRVEALRRYYDAAVDMESKYQADRAALQQRGDLGFQRAWENWADRARDVYSQVGETATRAFEGIENTIVDAVTTGKANFGDLARSIVTDIVRIYIKAQLLKIFEGIFGEGGWGSGLDLIGRAYRSFTGTGNMSESNTGAFVFHGGGRVGYDAPAAVRYQPAGLWNGAPRFHNGLATDEMRAILKKGESVLTPEQMRQLAPAGRGAAARLQVTLINQSGTELQATETRQRSDGGIEVVLQAAEQFMAERVGAGTGPLAGALRGRYGLRDALA